MRRRLIRRLAITFFVVSLLILAPELYLILQGVIVHKEAVGTALLIDGLTIGVLGVMVLSILQTVLSHYERAVLRLENSEASKAAVMNSSLDAILSVDGDGCILECNQAAERMFGFHGRQILGQPLSRFFQVPQGLEVGVPHLASFFADNVRPERGAFLEMIATLPDGIEFPAEVACTEVQVAGNLFYTFFIRDITTRKEAEESKIQAIRARDELLGVVSHELKNPLTAIGTSVSLLLRASPILKQDDSLGKTAENINTSVRRMSRLVSDLLDVTRIESGRLTLERTAVDVAEVTREAIEEYRPLATEKSLRLEYRVSPEEIILSCDRDRILQVLSNLLGNAIKFTEPGGSVSVRVDSAGGDVRFQVKDSGPGIPEGQLLRIFDRFWQAKQFAYRGTGLGLSISKGIVEAHGGRIWAESQVGQGTTITFTLPVKGAAIEPMASVA